MLTPDEIEREAMKLPDNARASLASRLLESLPAVLSDDDDGLSEALRRSADLEQNPASAMTLEEVKQAVRR